jgi:predicted DNA-binding protein
MMRVAEKKVRKTITLSPKAVKNLENLAEIYNKPHSVLIEELIEKETKEFEKKKRLEAIKRIKAYRKYFKGTIGNKTFQELKAEMGSEL